MSVKRNDEAMMQEQLTNMVEVMLGQRVPLSIDFDLMRDEYVVTWGVRHARVCITSEAADLAAFGVRAFSDTKAMELAAQWRRLIAARIAKGIEVRAS